MDGQASRAEPRPAARKNLPQRLFPDLPKNNRKLPRSCPGGQSIVSMQEYLQKGRHLGFLKLVGKLEGVSPT
jgi:hypothetical protein